MFKKDGRRRKRTGIQLESVVEISNFQCIDMFQSFATLCFDMCQSIAALHIDTGSFTWTDEKY